MQSSSQIITTNTQFFSGWMPFLLPNQQCQSTEGKISHSMDLLTPSSPGVFQLCLRPLTAPGYLGEGCHASHQPSDASTPSVTLYCLTIISTQNKTFHQSESFFQLFHTVGWETRAERKNSSRP